VTPLPSLARDPGSPSSLSILFFWRYFFFLPSVSFLVRNIHLPFSFSSSFAPPLVGESLSQAYFLLRDAASFPPFTFPRLVRAPFFQSSYRSCRLLFPAKTPPPPPFKYRFSWDPLILSIEFPSVCMVSPIFSYLRLTLLRIAPSFFLPPFFLFSSTGRPLRFGTRYSFPRSWRILPCSFPSFALSAALYLRNY